MSDHQRQRDLKFLGLESEAGDDKIIAECRRRCLLYAGNHPATYNLMGDGERRRMLGKVEEILSRVRASAGPPKESTTSSAEPTPGPSETTVQSMSEPPPDPVQSPGGFLKYSRLSRHQELEEISAETKIPRRKLVALEEEDLSVLPAAVFVRGFVVAVARTLKLEDPDTLARMYLEKMASSGAREP